MADKDPLRPPRSRPKRQRNPKTGKMATNRKGRTAEELAKYGAKGNSRRNGPNAAPEKGGMQLPPRPKMKHPSVLTGAQMMADRAIGGKCGAKTRAGGQCSQPAGFGTDHYGLGRCKYHGGSTATGRKRAVVEQARLLGAPIDMNPVEAIIWSIRIVAGEVKWLSVEIAKLEPKVGTGMTAGIESTLIGKQFHLYVRERRDRLALLHKMGVDALKLGLAERAVKMAEMYGIALSRFIMGVLEDLQMTPDQAERAPSIVRKHLVMLEGGVSAADLEVIENGEFEELHAQETKQLVA